MKPTPDSDRDRRDPASGSSEEPEGAPAGSDPPQGKEEAPPPEPLDLDPYGPRNPPPDESLTWF
jgi:hypothetical protein